VLSPSERSLRARIGAFSLHAQRDPAETTAKAREAFLKRFIEQVDPARALPESERLRRAEAARRAYFARLAFASARTRSARRQRRGRGSVMPMVLLSEKKAVEVAA
jgi:hypothetical protein